MFTEILKSNRNQIIASLVKECKITNDYDLRNCMARYMEYIVTEDAMMLHEGDDLAYLLTATEWFSDEWTKNNASYNIAEVNQSMYEMHRNNTLACLGKI